MELQKIYKRDASGGIRIWWAETDDKAYWRTNSGILDGEIVTSEWRYAPAKSQSNTREQSLFEAQAAMDKKLKLDYKTSLKQIDIERNSTIKPMLAHKYAGWEGQCYSQPKLDGMRCLATPTGLWSRNNRKVLAAPHIEKYLQEFFTKNPNIILDGELYQHDFHDNFNAIMSMARKTVNISLRDLELSRKYLQYWVYDIYDQNKPNDSYSKRLKKLDNIYDMFKFEWNIIKVSTEIINSEEELDYHFANLLKEGYEGQMIRYDRAYEQKRSNYLLKRKEFIDEEFTLLDIEEGAGNWENFGKRAICATPNGKIFGAGISGTQEFCAQLLKDKKRYSAVTVKYHELTPDGVPRFPIAIKFHEVEFSTLNEIIKPKKDLFK